MAPSLEGLGSLTRGHLLYIIFNGLGPGMQAGPAWFCVDVFCHAVAVRTPRIDLATVVQCDILKGPDRPLFALECGQLVGHIP